MYVNIPFVIIKKLLTILGVRSLLIPDLMVNGFWDKIVFLKMAGKLSPLVPWVKAGPVSNVSWG